MPEYTYRREDGTTFSIRQKFTDDPLTIDAETGQKVVRVVQPAGIIFKGSGFYVNDSKASKRNLTASNGHTEGSDNGAKTDSSANGTETGSKAKEKTPASPAAAD